MNFGVIALMVATRSWPRTAVRERPVRYSRYTAVVPGFFAPELTLHGMRAHRCGSRPSTRLGKWDTPSNTGTADGLVDGAGLPSCGFSRPAP